MRECFLKNSRRDAEIAKNAEFWFNIYCFFMQLSEMQKKYIELINHSYNICKWRFAIC